MNETHNSYEYLPSLKNFDSLMTVLKLARNRSGREVYTSNQHWQYNTWGWQPLHYLEFCSVSSNDTLHYFEYVTVVRDK
jgi:hypothetical protein